MENQEAYPKSLVVIAVLFILYGLYSLGVTVNDFMQGDRRVQLFGLALFAGIGLLVRTELWRKISLLIVCFFLVVIPVFAAAAWFTGQEVATRTLIVSVLFFGISAWLYRMLTREEIKQHFTRQQELEAGTEA
jgi:hypothetical protein